LAAVFVFGLLVGPRTALADGISGGAIIINGSSVVPIDTPVSLSAGSVTHIFTYVLPGGGIVAIAAVTTPPPPAGANNQPNPNVPAIQLPPPPPPPGGGPVPPGPVIQIPQVNHVVSKVQNGGYVTVTYDDGATATVPGTLLNPGTSPAPGTPTSFDLEPGTGMIGWPPAEADLVFTDFVNDPNLTADLGYSLTLSDFSYNFSGSADFTAWTGPITFTYPDSAAEQVSLSETPEPASAVLWLSGLAGIQLLRCNRRRRISR